MSISLRSLVAPALMALAAHAASWAPIPPEVWALKDDPSKGIKDAVILEDRTILKGTYMERILRIRVLSESGRKAANLDAFSEACYEFDGRTVYPDGRELRFEKRQDFKEDTTEVGEFSFKQKLVVPPGVTSNCVVELRWLESTGEFWFGRAPLPARMGYATQLRFGREYLTLKESVEIPTNFGWAYIPLSGKTQKLNFEERGSFRVFSVNNLAAQELPPFALPVSQDRPSLAIFYQPEGIGRFTKKSQKEFWDAVGKFFWKDDFETGISKGRHYEALRAKVFAGITSNLPLEVASALIGALEKEVVNLSHLSHEESAKQAKEEKVPPGKELGEICQRRVANGWGMTMLFYHLLKDAGFRPKVALLADRDVQLFRPNLYNPWQAMHAVAVVEDSEKGMGFYDPSQRFGAPGLIHPDFQGVQGLLLDPNAGWSGQPFQVPVQPATFNQKRYEYALELGSEEERYQLKAQFSGFPELAERRRYDVDEQKERDRKLKERFEKNLTGTTILRAEVQNAANPEANVSWVVEAQREVEGSRQRHIQPFPGLTYPLSVPDSMPAERTLPIVMPYLQVQLAKCTFKIPKGYRAHLGQPSQLKNSIGSVAWVAELKKQGEDDQVLVVMKVTVDSMFAPPTAYEELKTYLNWITEAFKRTVVLEKV